MPDTEPFSLLDHPECWPLDLVINPLSIRYDGCQISSLAALPIIREHMIRRLAQGVPLYANAVELIEGILSDSDEYLYELFTRAKEESK